MNLILVFILTFFGSCLTFFSGFGLGTILLPLFLAFYSPEIAILAVAIVHFSNSVFKFFAVYKFIKKDILIRFGISAVTSAFFGAMLLTYIGNIPKLGSYQINGHDFHIEGLNFSIGLLIILFTWMESSKSLNKLNFTEKHLVLGGVLSGFFGGLSGHQGALRSLFLKQANLSKEEFVGTSNAISLAIDIVRIATYFWFLSIGNLLLSEDKSYIFIGIIGAFLGVRVGLKLLKKITLEKVHFLISTVLIIFGLLLMFGII